MIPLSKVFTQKYIHFFGNHLLPFTFPFRWLYPIVSHYLLQIKLPFILSNGIKHDKEILERLNFKSHWIKKKKTMLQWKVPFLHYRNHRAQHLLERKTLDNVSKVNACFTKRWRINKLNLQCTEVMRKAKCSYVYIDIDMFFFLSMCSDELCFRKFMSYPSSFFLKLY